MEEHLPLPHVASADLPDPQTPAQNLVQLIKQLIKEQQYEGVALLFTSEIEAPRNLTCMEDAAMELLHEVCLQHLNESNHANNVALYGCAEELLKVIAAHAPVEELLLELLEMVEEQKSEYVFTSSLRALQVVLLRLGDQKPRALEWSLSSIHNRMEELPMPEYLKEGYDEKQQRLLEQNEEVQSLLMHYITVGLFYTPILQHVTSKQRPAAEIFRACGINRRNVLCCFLVQLLGKPLSLLDLSIDERNTNTYTVQCARDLTQAVTHCIGDPYYFFGLAELRVRWKRRDDAANGVPEKSCSNIFLVEEKLPLDAMAIYIYMVLVERLCLDVIPKVYAPLYVFDAGLYLAAELLHHDEPALHYRGLLLTKRLLAQLHETAIPSVFLELEVHKNFCYSLCNIVGYSQQIQLRQEGVQILRKYILQFDDEGKYLVLKNLMRSIGHTGISGYLAIIYKDVVAKALLTPSVPLPTSFSGQDFRSIFLHNICQLPQGAETDLIENSDKVISSLNALRFFAINDCHNRTGFWDFLSDIEKQFIDPLRKGLDLSIAHYKAELQRVEKGLNGADEVAQCEKLKMLDISISNATSEKSKVDFEMDRQQKMQILNQNLCSFDLMRCLLARATECVDNSVKLCKPKLIMEKAYAHYSLLACSTYASSVLLRKQQLRSQRGSLQQQQQQQVQLLLPHSHLLCGSRALTSQQQRHLGRNSSSAYSDTATSIDEFRAREEQRERDFASQKTAEEAARQKDSSESAEEKAKRAKIEALRTKILEAALLHVPTLGWSRQTIVQGAEDVGLPSVVHGMFPEGGFALVSYFYGKCNGELLKWLRAETQNGEKQVQDPLEFLVRAVRMRLEMTASYKGQWPQALALITLPQNASTALAQVLTLVDDICYYSGDRSVDFGWYTRRVGLATIMKMTELYMLQDSSPQHVKTWEFLKNRMDEAMQMQMMLSQTENVTHTFQRSFNSAFVTARNILGLGFDRR